MATPSTTYYTLNDCCTNIPINWPDSDAGLQGTLYLEFDGNSCNDGDFNNTPCPNDLTNLIITEIVNEAQVNITGCLKLTSVSITEIPVGADIVDWPNIVQAVETVPTCEDCQTCPVYYTINNCCTNEPYTIDDQIVCFVYTGLCEPDTCPQDLLPLTITSISSEATPDYITGCFKLTQVQSVPPGAFTTNYLNAIASVETVSTCAECQECCYKLTNCKTDEIIYSNTSTLIQHFGNTVTLNGQEGCWQVGISAGNCDCINVTFVGASGSDIYQANATGTYNGYNLYEFIAYGDNAYIYFEPGKGWFMSLNGYGNAPSEIELAFTTFDGECPDSANEGFTWSLGEVILNSIQTEVCPAECECPIPVTVLQSFEDCPSCLPIIAYKFTNCNNQILVQYSTEDYSAYVGKTVELECGDCWFVSQIDYTPPSIQTITILYTFDSCIICNRTYYKLTDCLDPTNVTYTYSDLSSVIPDPISCNDCIRVSFTYDGVDYEYEVPKIGIDGSGYNVYAYYENNVSINISFNSSDGYWSLLFENSIGQLFFTNYTDVNCPVFSDWTVSFGDFEVENFVTTECTAPLPVIKIKGCDTCFTVEETREPINAGIVTITDSFIDCPECLLSFPCICNTITNTSDQVQTYCYIDCNLETQSIELQPGETSDKLCVIKWIECPESLLSLDTAFIETFGDCVNNQCPVEPLPKRKVKPGYSTPTCDIEKYEKITCKASEFYYKQVMRLRYGISNCCPEDEEKWLVKKDLIDLDALRDPDYICKPVTSCCNQPISSCGCDCNTTLKTCNS